MIRTEDVYKIGKIGKPHGINGEVSFMFDDDVFDRTDSDYLILLIDGILVPFFFEEYRFKTGETALVKFCDIDSKEQAQELTGCDVYFARELAGDDGLSSSLHSIAGFTMTDAADNNKPIGTITSVDDSTVNILFNVTTPEGRDILIPASEEYINDINIEKREIRVSLPEGLLDLE